ncbi:DNA replication/repair protein RecF [soil metagenome]
MRLDAIKTENFRNIKGEIHWGRGLNILFGENGHGKTNWLEAIYVLATARSFKTAKLQETIQFGEEMATIGGRVHQSEGIERDLTATIVGNIKSFAVNGKRETAQNYLGEVFAVLFNADELSIVRGMPDQRRRFLDSGIVSLHPPFVQTYTDFGRVLRQKNKLLQTARDRELSVQKAAELLSPWNEQLIGLAARIHKGRMRFVQRINEALEAKLFGREEISIKYVSSLEGKGDLADYEALLAERLRLRVHAELVAGYSLVGPQRDDMEIQFDGHDIRKYGSAGQQRSVLLQLQLANISVFHMTHGEYPLFLLDDIDAELDYRRIGQLLEFLDGKTQTFVTTSKKSFVDDFGGSASVYNIENGVAVSLAASA